jgi:hypothetical protein
VRDALKRTIRRAEKAILAIARARYPSCGIFSFGAVDIDPVNLAIWITSATDVQRDVLRRDPEFQASIRQALREVGYPAGAIDGVAFEIESQETVDRDHQGSWWYAVK